MKCIKEKCKYCREHDFFASYCSCILSGVSFKKDNDLICDIDTEIVTVKSMLKSIEEQRQYIESQQEEEKC